MTLPLDTHYLKAILFPLHHRKGNKVRHFPTSPLKHGMKERLDPVPHKIHPSPAPSFFQSGKFKKKKKYVCFLKAQEQGPFENKKEGEGQMRKKDFLAAEALLSGREAALGVCWERWRYVMWQ